MRWILPCDPSLPCNAARWGGLSPQRKYRTSSAMCRHQTQGTPGNACLICRYPPLAEPAHRCRHQGSRVGGHNWRQWSQAAHALDRSLRHFFEDQFVCEYPAHALWLGPLGSFGLVFPLGSTDPISQSDPRQSDSRRYRGS